MQKLQEVQEMFFMGDNTNDNGHPRTAQQTITLSTEQAASQLGVDARSVRRYINNGIRLPDGTYVKLRAKLVHGQNWVIDQIDLDAFIEVRDHAKVDGITSDELRNTGQDQTQALQSLSNLFAAELERRSQEVAQLQQNYIQAQQTIAELSHAAGREAGLREALEAERTELRQRLEALERERDQWRDKAIEALTRKPPHRTNLIPWLKSEQ